jgi:hypothetical protein
MQGRTSTQADHVTLYVGEIFGEERFGTSFFSAFLLNVGNLWYCSVNILIGSYAVEQFKYNCFRGYDTRDGFGRTA